MNFADDLSAFVLTLLSDGNDTPQEFVVGCQSAHAGCYKAFVFTVIGRNTAFGQNRADNAPVTTDDASARGNGQPDFRPFVIQQSSAFKHPDQFVVFP